MKNFLLLFFCAMMLFSCKSKPINQKIDKKKEGLWIDNYEQDSTTYKSFEYYKNDQPVKKWKFYSDKGKLTEIKKYNNGDLISEKAIE